MKLLSSELQKGHIEWFQFKTWLKEMVAQFDFYLPLNALLPLSTRSNKGLAYVLNGKLVPRVYHWNTFSITRVYLTTTDVSAFTSTNVSDYKKNDPPSDYSWAKPCLTIDRVIRRLVRLSAVSWLALLIVVLVSTWSCIYTHIISRT